MLKLFWWRVSFLGLVILIQFSFVNVLFPQSAVPGMLLSVVASLVLVRGFRTSVVEWGLLLVFYDVLRAGEVTAIVLVGITLAYLVSFVSRRFIFEHTGMGLFLLGLLVASVSVLGMSLLSIMGATMLAGWFYQLVDFGMILLVFSPIFLLVQWFEGRVQEAQRSQFRGLRHA